MNNKFFADRNDFFKYDLLLEILEKSHLLKQLTFIPMLTPNDDRRGGHRTNYSRGLMREELFRFLQDCLVNSKRDIRELRRFFGNRGFRYFPYRDSEFFRHESRNEYFRNVPVSALHKALVFLDPDNGLEVASMRAENGDRYVKYDETGTLSPYGRLFRSGALSASPSTESPTILFRNSQEAVELSLSPGSISRVKQQCRLCDINQGWQKVEAAWEVLASYADAQGLLFMSGINLRS